MFLKTTLREIKVLKYKVTKQGVTRVLISDFKLLYAITLTDKTLIYFLT